MGFHLLIGRYYLINQDYCQNLQVIELINDFVRQCHTHRIGLTS